MTIAQTRFWIDTDSRQIGIRSSNGDGQPFECWLNKHPRWLDFNIYESSNDSDRVEFRLSFALLWFSLNMLLWTAAAREDAHRCDDRDRKWGWSVLDRSIYFGWGEKKLFWDIPFITTVCDGSKIMSLGRNRVVFDNSGKRFLESYEQRKKAIEEHSVSFPYSYELNNGEVQNVTAKAHVERHVRRRKWTPFATNDDSISVEFSEEVGPERGSWKGGCTGCGWTMRKGETARACLRRMERDRRFER